jgi:hypothetical protein
MKHHLCVVFGRRQPVDGFPVPRRRKLSNVGFWCKPRLVQLFVEVLFGKFPRKVGLYFRFNRSMFEDLFRRNGPFSRKPNYRVARHSDICVVATHSLTR